MQDFVEEYIAAQRAKLGKACKDLDKEHIKAAKDARDARLIRLGMCKKEYSESTVYDAAYPYQEYKTGRYYNLIPFEVSDEEYAEICRYDEQIALLAPRGITRRIFGNTAKKLRVLALPFAISMLIASIIAAVLLYRTEESFALLAIGVGAFGIWLSFLGGLLTYAAGEILARLDRKTVETVKKTALPEEEEA